MEDSTPADVKDWAGAYEYVIDMPGIMCGDIKVEVEDDTVLVISGESKKDDQEGKVVKYLRRDKRIPNFNTKFVLPKDADVLKISDVCHNGVLTVTVFKFERPVELRKRKTIGVQKLYH